MPSTHAVLQFKLVEQLKATIRTTPLSHTDTQEACDSIAPAGLTVPVAPVAVAAPSASDVAPVAVAAPSANDVSINAMQQKLTEQQQIIERLTAENVRQTNTAVEETTSNVAALVSPALRATFRRRLVIQMIYFHV